jgi:hypothetical protein
MTYFTTIEPDAASGKVVDLVAQAQKTLGSTANLALNMLTNYFNIMAHVDNDWPVVSL